MLQGAALLFGSALALKLLQLFAGVFRWAGLGALVFLRWLMGINRVRAGFVSLLSAGRSFIGGWQTMRGLLSGLFTAAAVTGLVGRIALLRGALRGLGVAVRFLLGPWGLLATTLLTLIPDSWWTKAGELLQQGFDWIKGIVSGAVDGIVGLINRIKSAIQNIGNLSLPSISGGGTGDATVPGSSAPSTMEGMGFEGGRARGGSVYAGRLYAVGERGPELFMPSSSGRIIPNHQLGGGAPVVVSATFHIHGATDPSAVARAVSMRLNQIARSAVHDGVYD